MKSPRVFVWLLMAATLVVVHSVATAEDYPVEETNATVRLLASVETPCISLVTPEARVSVSIREIEASGKKYPGLKALTKLEPLLSAAPVNDAGRCAELNAEGYRDEGFYFLLAQVLESGKATVTVRPHLEDPRSPAQRRLGASYERLGSPVLLQAMLVRDTKQLPGSEQRPGDMWYHCTSFFAEAEHEPIGHGTTPFFGHCEMFRH